jgi:hypothetical protein
MGEKARQPETRQVSGDAALVERIDAITKAHHPFAYCLSCLAKVLMRPERSVREAAQIAILRDHLRVERRTCYQCGRSEDAITVKPRG